MSSAIGRAVGPRLCALAFPVPCEGTASGDPFLEDLPARAGQAHGSQAAAIHDGVATE
jgi:hypothetical protein